MDLGDGTGMVGAQVDHSYTWAGNFTVRLYIMDDENFMDSTSLITA